MEKPEVRKHEFTVPLPAPRYWQSRHQHTRVTTGNSKLVQRTEPQRHLGAMLLMENALYYTFSTIAQALAAAFALLGAFVLVRLQQVAATSSASAAVVIRPYLPNEEARRLLACGKLAELSTFLATQQHQRPGAIGSHAYAAASDALAKNLALRKSMLSRLLRAMVVTAVVITSAVVVLAVTPLIAPFAGFSWLTLIVGIAGLVVSLVFYGRRIWCAIQ